MARYGLGAMTFPWYAYYNGTNGNNQPEGPYPKSGYGIGRAKWMGGDSGWTRDNPGGATVPVAANSLLPTGRYMKTPRMLKVGSTYRLYVDSANASYSQWGVRLLTASSPDGPFTDQGEIGVTTGAGVDAFPVVIEDPDDPDTNQRFKMWASVGWTSNHNLHYFYSPDGLPGTWTDYGVVLSATAAWEYSASSGYNQLMLPSTALRVNGEWLLYYSTKFAAASGPDFYWHTGLARFTNPKSTYSSKTQVVELENDNFYALSTTLGANVAAGASTFTVSDPSKITVGQPYFIGTQPYAMELLRVGGKVGSTISLESGTTFANAHLAAGSNIIHGMARSMIPTYVVYDSDADKWRLFGTIFEAGVAFEDEVQMESAEPDGPWSYIWSSSPVMPRVPVNRWDGVSAENLCLITDASVPTRSLLYEENYAGGFGNSTSSGYGSAEAYAYPAALTIDPASTAWEQIGTSIVVRTTSDASTTTAVIICTNGGLVRFRGTDSDNFEASLDGTTWASSIDVPAGETTIHLRVTPEAPGTTLTAEIGVPV